MAISTALERVGYDGPSGSIQTGQHRPVISGVGATRTLLPKESGALCLFDRAAGVVYTLPTPVEGMYFDFQTTVTITSNAAKTITKTPASEFILGLLMVFGGTTESIVSADFNGTTHVAISSNGTTTGGVIGDRYRLTAISATKWVIDGYVSGSGTVATPAATS